MKRKSQIDFCSLIGGVFGAAIGIALPIWPVYYADLGMQRPLWAAFGGFYMSASSLDYYCAPLVVTAMLVAVGEVSARRFAVRLAAWTLDRRMMRGCCDACGYNLSGNTSGVRLECGTPVTMRIDAK